MDYIIQELKDKITKSIKPLIKDRNIEIKIEKPLDTSLGDFSLPCFKLSPVFKKSPEHIAKDFREKIQIDERIEKIEEKNGYVNFFIDYKKIARNILINVFQKKTKYGFLEEKRQKVIIEHTSANPNGPLHIGRARNPIIGDTIVRIFRAAGYQVESQFYLDDMGKQVAILAWGINNLKEDFIQLSKRKKPDHQTVGYYQTASKMQDENFEVSDEIQQLVKKSENGDKKIQEIIKKAYTPVLKGIKESLKKINIEIEKYVPESKFLKNKSVDLVVSKLKNTEYTGQEKGAYYIDMKPFKIKGRNTKFFFLRKDKTTLYATRDIAYHLWKGKNADLLINILGEDHKLESKQVKVALKLIGAEKIPKVIFYSFVSLPGGKMSTRKARVVYLDDLIDECIKRAYNEVKKRRGNDLSESKMRKISEKIGIGALRYNIIKVQPEKSIVFKWQDALNFEGNSAPYIQYSHARAASILKKYNKKVENENEIKITDDQEIHLVKKISEFPEIISQACNEFKPHLIAFYLFELASYFNQFYRDCPVLSEKDKKIIETRLKIVKATKIVLKNGLNLLGIEALDEM